MLETPDATASSTPVLDDGLVHERQHFLRLRLGGRQEPGAQARGGEHGFANRRTSRRSSPSWRRMGGNGPASIGFPPCSIRAFVREHLDQVQFRACKTAASQPDASAGGARRRSSERRRAVILEVETPQAGRRTRRARKSHALKRLGQDRVGGCSMPTGNAAQRIKQLDAELEALEEQRQASLLSSFPTCPIRACRSAATAARQPRGAARRRSAGVRLHAEGALGPRAGARHHRLRARGEDGAVRASRSCSARARGCRARSSTSCSNSTRASTATARSRRRSW